MSKILNELKNQLGLGARTNRYKIIINGKNGFEGKILDTLCKTTTMPSKSLSDKEIWYQGRKLTFAGETEFDGSWTVTFMDSQDLTIRNKILNWLNMIDNIDNHSKNYGTPSSYMGTAKVTQLNTSTNANMYSITIEDIYPKSISEISYSDEDSNIIEFSVDFNYSYWH